MAVRPREAGLGRSRPVKHFLNLLKGLKSASACRKNVFDKLKSIRNCQCGSSGCFLFSDGSPGQHFPQDLVDHRRGGLALELPHDLAY